MQKYSVLQRLLHDLLSSNKIINKSLYELEKFFFLKKKNIENNTHVFITGLPRSGSTTLLNFIFSLDDYASLKYKNMPFVMSPHFGKAFNQKKIPKKERLHSDGILFNLDSPEAFDEVFFNNNEEFVKDELINYLTLATNFSSGYLW